MPWLALWAKIEPYVSWLIILIVSGWLVFAGAIKPVMSPNPSTVQSGGVSYTIHVGFGGCARLTPTVMNKKQPPTQPSKVVTK